MTIIAKQISYALVGTPDGDVVLKAKAGETPEFKPNVGSIESTDDGMTNTGELILNHQSTRSYLQGVFGYVDSDQPKLQAAIDLAKTAADSETTLDVVFTDGSILSNTGVIVNPLIHNAPGTFEFRFESALDFIPS